MGCDEKHFEANGHKARDTWGELCTERGCCFFPGRDNCEEEYPVWCEEFSACENVNLFLDDDDMGDQNDNQDNNINSQQTDNGDESDLLLLEEMCTKELINQKDNYDQCKSICSKRSCCFHWGKENCLEEKEDWCDDFELC